MLLSKYPIDVSLQHYEHETAFGGDCSDCLSDCFGVSGSIWDIVLDLATGFGYSASKAVALSSSGCFLNCFKICEKDVEDHSDAFASKGFIYTIIDVGGFPVYIFNTHLDASGAALEQVGELGSRINFLRILKPFAGFIVMGDFNIPKDYTPIILNPAIPYFSILSTLGVSDAFSAGCCGEDCNAFTDDPDNEFKKAYNEAYSPGKTIDYIFYSNGVGFNMVPTSAVVKKYQASSPISDGGKSSKDLSDHNAVVVEFSLTR